jgi:UDP-N-acetyl-D-glucosamine dehydrogenase
MTISTELNEETGRVEHVGAAVNADELLYRIDSKQITVGIIGLGYVGLPLSVVFAEAGVKVLGMDVDRQKVSALAEGCSYINHIESERVQAAKEKRTFACTLDFSRASECDALIICVPTPLNTHLEPDLHYIEDTCRAVGPYLKPGCLVSLESTTWPGTTDEVVRPILEKLSGLKAGRDLFLCFSPEREDPGNPDYGTRDIPKLVGGIDANSLRLGVALYRQGITSVVPLSDTRVAESAKLFENIFRSVNIALVNELKVIFDKMGIDVWEVIRAAGTKPFGFMPFWPGPGLGGHCIPIDPYYLTWKAKEFGINTRFIELAGEINRSMPIWVLGKIQDCLNNEGKAIKGSRILVMGLAYKPDVSDMRESPSLELMTLLEAKGGIVDFHDPYITEIGSTREYQSLVGRQSQPLSRRYDCFVLATNHSQFCVDEILSQGVPVIDTRNFLPNHELVHRA